MAEGIELRNLGDKARASPPLPPRHPAAGSSDSPSGGLGRAYRLAEEKAKAAVHLQEGGLDTVAYWGCGAAIW
jgi:hypothetical protein